MNEGEMQISIPAAGTVVGTSVGALTYLLLSESGEATATLTGKSCRVVGYLVGKGAEYVAGATVGQTVQFATSEFGDLFLVPCIRKGSRATAVVVAGAAGVAASLVTAAAVHSGRFVSRKVMEYISSRTHKAADCSGEFDVLEEEDCEFVCVERRVSDADPSTSADAADAAITATTATAITTTEKQVEYTDMPAEEFSPAEL
jgi:hypothetical protein